MLVLVPTFPWAWLKKDVWSCGPQLTMHPYKEPGMVTVHT